MSEIPKRPPFPETFGITRNEAAEFTSQAIAHEHAVAVALWDEVTMIFAESEAYLQTHEESYTTRVILERSQRAIQRVLASGWKP